MNQMQSWLHMGGGHSEVTVSHNRFLRDAWKYRIASALTERCIDFSNDLEHAMLGLEFKRAVIWLQGSVAFTIIEAGLLPPRM